MLCLYPLAISESWNISLNNFPFPLAEANEELESTVLSAYSFDEKTALGLVVVETLEGLNEIVLWF